MQEHWNELEGLLVSSVDSLAPLTFASCDPSKKKPIIPNNIQCKIYTRKRLLRSDKMNNATVNHQKIKKTEYGNKNLLCESKSQQS